MIRVEVQHLLSSLGVGCVLLCTLVLAAWLWGVCIVSSGWADLAVATLFVMDPYLSSVRSSRLSSSLLFQDTSLSLPHGRLTGLQGPRASVGSLPCSWSVTMPLRALSVVSEGLVHSTLVSFSGSMMSHCGFQLVLFL